jgi:hypothetical protein
MLQCLCYGYVHHIIHTIDMISLLMTCMSMIEKTSINYWPQWTGYEQVCLLGNLCLFTTTRVLIFSLNTIIAWHETNYEHLTYNKYLLLLVFRALSPTTCCVHPIKPTQSQRNPMPLLLMVPPQVRPVHRRGRVDGQTPRPRPRAMPARKWS